MTGIPELTKQLIETTLHEKYIGEQIPVIEREFPFFKKNI